MTGHLNAALAYKRSDFKPEDEVLVETPLLQTFFSLDDSLILKNVNLSTK
jgi:hypothetical protein